MSADEETGRLTQPERSARTRHKLLAAAEALWAEKNFDDTTVSDICEAAGVAKGTFYLHFPRKEDLLLEMGFMDIDEISELIDSLIADDKTVDEVLRACIDLLVTQARKRPRHLMGRAIEELFATTGTWAERKGEHHGYAEVFIRVFTIAQQRGEVTARFIPLELAASLVMGLLQSLLWWTTGRARASLDTLLWRRVEMVMFAARAPMEGSA